MLCKITVIAIIAVSSSLTGADILREEWVVVEDGQKHLKDLIHDSITDSSGNTYVTGYVDSPGIGYPATLSTAKYDNQGVKLWENLYHLDDDDLDIGLAIAIDNASNVFVTGIHSDTPNPVGNDSDTDLFTIKYDAAGRIEWREVYNGSLDIFDMGRDIAVDSEGNVLVTGVCNRGTGLSDVLTIKYDNNGTVLWEDIYSGTTITSVNSGYFVLCDASCNVYVVALTSLSGTNFALLVRKLDPAGTELWLEEYDPELDMWQNYLDATIDDIGNTYVLLNLSDVGNYSPTVLKYCPSGGAPIWIWDDFENLAPGEYEQGETISLSDNGLFIAGYFKRSASAYTDIKVTKLDTDDGSENWATLYNGPENRSDRPHAIQADNEGNVYIGGRANSTDGPPFNEDDAVLLRMDSDTGGILASAIFDNNSLWESFGNVGIDDAGEIYATGGTITQYSSGEDRLIVKYVTTKMGNLSISNEPALFSLFPVHPNPTAGYANIDFALTHTENVTLKIYDINGRCVATPVDGEMSDGIHSVSIDASSLAAGVYFYSFSAQGENCVRKMIVLE